MKLRNVILLATTSLAALGFKNDAGWKTKADGSIETDGDGNPIYITDDGAETTVKYETAVQLRGEAKNYRTRAENAEKALKAFEGIDPAAARDALDKVKDVDFTKLVDAGKIDEVKQQMTSQFQAQIDAANKERDDTRRENADLRLNNAFNSSEFLKERLAVPSDAATALYRSRFKVDGDKVVPLNEAGEPLYSSKRAGEIATVDEAFEQFITARPDKDNWIKAPDASGSGSQGNGGGRGQGNIIKQSDYDAMSQMDKAAIGQRLAKGEVRLV